jgi:predicted DNA-binding transcriptional regulator YafY
MIIEMESGQLKTIRILQIFERLIQRQVINKRALAEEFQVSDKSIQRDIEDLRTYLSEFYKHQNDIAIVYSDQKKGYHLQSDDRYLISHMDILVLAKVLLESRAFPKEELSRILDKLIEQAPGEHRKHIREMIKNELFLYIPVRHNQPLFAKMWDLSFAVRERRLVQMNYLRVNEQQPVSMSVQPLGLIFSDYYFYLVAYIEGVERDYPATFRIDRIADYAVSGDRFHVSERSRFQEGIFRQQVQFMQTGKLMKIKFRFWNKSLESILDRLPNAKVTMDGEVALIEAEVFGKGIMMWLLGQGANVEVLGPPEFREEIAETARRVASIYGV